jgi:hypothetical protein
MLICEGFVKEYKKENGDSYAVEDSEGIRFQYLQAIGFLAASSSVAEPHHFDADPDPIFHFDVDPNPDPSFRRKRLETLKKCSNMISFRTFWLVIGKLMRIRIQLITLMRIRIQLITLMPIRIRIIPFDLMRIRIRNIGIEQFKIYVHIQKCSPLLQLSLI